MSRLNSCHPTHQFTQSRLQFPRGGGVLAVGEAQHEVSVSRWGSVEKSAGIKWWIQLQLRPLGGQQRSCPTIVMDGKMNISTHSEAPPGETCSLEDEWPVDTTTSNHRGKGRPVRVLQGFIVDEGKNRNWGDSVVWTTLLHIYNYVQFNISTCQPHWIS